jgi:adenylate cyclase
MNTGEAFVGNMGSRTRFDYSIVGDMVNIAARLEEATKELGVQILVSESTIKAAPHFCFVPLGAIDLKGKSQSTKVYALQGALKDASDDFAEFLDLHAAALAAAEARAPDAPLRIKNARTHRHGEAYAQFYARLTQDRRNSP